MKALFCYDGPVWTDGEGRHYSPVLNNRVYDRYLEHADTLTVAIRVAKCAPEEAAPATLIDESRVDFLPIPNLSSLSGTVLQRRKAKQLLMQAMREADFAIIRLPSFIGAVAVRVARQLHKPYLVEVVGCAWDSLWNFGLKGKLIAPWLSVSMRCQVLRARYVIYVTNQFLQSRYPTKGLSANCSNVEIDAPDEAALRDRLAKIDRPGKTKIIGTAAAVHVPYKGHQYVIEALGRLKKQGRTDFCYQMAGGGDPARLKKIAEEQGVTDQIEFLGSLPRAELFAWLDQIDLYAQPSRQEGLPRALIEAMSRGVPCIGARTGGIPELLPPERTFHNSEQTVAEICALLTAFTPEMMKADAVRNHDAAKVYTIDKIKARRDRMLDELVSAAKA